MLIDPFIMQQLGQLKMKERLEQAEKQRLLKEIAGSDSSFVESILTIVSGWMQNTKPTPYSVEPKRVTAEIPSL